MSSCPPSTLLGTEPPFAPFLVGRADNFTTGAVELIGFNPTWGESSVSDDPRYRIMWEQGCKGDRVTTAVPDVELNVELMPGFEDAPPELVEFFEKPVEFFWNDVRVPVEPAVCQIPESEWNDVWQDAAASGEKPYDFLENPIEWIRFELGGMVRSSIHWWMEIGDPLTKDGAKVGGSRDGGRVVGASPSEAIYGDLVSSTLFVSGVIAVVSLLFVAGRMALQRDARPARDLVRAMIILVVVTTCGLVFIQILVQASDAFCKYFIVRALPAETTDDDSCTILEQHIAQISMSFSGMNFFVFLICAAFFLVGSLVMLLYMVARVFVVTVLAGMLPLSAASTATEAGKAWFGKQVSYLMAFILIKPCATVIFVASIRFSTAAYGESLGSRVTAAAFLCFGTVLLPAMTRLIFPFTSAAAQGDKTAMSLADKPRAAGAALAKGAISRIRR